MLTPDLFTLKCCYWQTHVTTWALRACCFSFWARICLDGTTGKQMHMWLAQRQPKMCLYRGTVPDLRPLKRALVLHENMPLRLLFEGWRGSSQNLIHSSVVSPPESDVNHTRRTSSSVSHSVNMFSHSFGRNEMFTCSTRAKCKLTRRWIMEWFRYFPGGM